ncbi:MAG: hypothetical protein IT567_06385 [Alphaproteobacteria bacterium]|nr:hypothetical protein [Alphaproteobacteria bacterium]
MPELIKKVLKKVVSDPFAKYIWNPTAEIRSEISEWADDARFNLIQAFFGIIDSLASGLGVLVEFILYILGGLLTIIIAIAGFLLMLLIPYAINAVVFGIVGWVIGLFIGVPFAHWMGQIGLEGFTLWQAGVVLGLILALFGTKVHIQLKW